MQAPSQRLISLDAFRGFTIALMILVNNPGSWSYVIPPFRHAAWHGCTPTDLVFPFFLYVMGVAMAFSFARREQLPGGRTRLYVQIFRRSLILLALGWFLHLFPAFNFSQMRIPGVLPRIALCYFFTAMIVVHSGKRGQVVVIAGLLLGYWAMMTLIPFPGKGEDPWAFGGNFAQHIDNLILQGHMWKPDFDPEGLISTIPAIATTLFGFLTGNWLRSQHTPLEKACGLFVAANLSLVIALIGEIWMPLNKQLWTSSYVLYTLGLALHFLAVSYWLIDIKGKKWGTKPFVVFGSNAILAYFGSTFVVKCLSWWKLTLTEGTQISASSYIYKSILQPAFGDWAGSLVYPILHLLLWLGILTWLYRRRIFLKI